MKTSVQETMKVKTAGKYLMRRRCGSTRNSTKYPSIRYVNEIDFVVGRTYL